MTFQVFSKNYAKNLEVQQLHCFGTTVILNLLNDQQDYGIDINFPVF